jgi:hypothetical protein
LNHEKHEEHERAEQFDRHPPLELRSSGMRGTHAHRIDQVFMGGPDKPGHDG